MLSLCCCSSAACPVSIPRYGFAGLGILGVKIVVALVKLVSWFFFEIPLLKKK